ncbi:hypothetical protein [Paeniglutamicibacter antarcticus]|uniref:Membrane protein n=1 Tax=Paeniglutamicibacter antarcticus TaxID=494023 RepID=A0ABP9TIT8_9MICC
MTLALLAALLGTVGYGAGSVLQAAGASRASGPAVVVQPLYLLGLGCDGVAWLASLVALQWLPLFAVQALLAGSLAITVILARIFLGARLRVKDRIAIGAVGIALVTVAAAAGAESATVPPVWFAPALLASMALVVAAMLILYRAGGTMGMAVVAGLAFSGAALGARSLVGVSSPWQVVSEPVAWSIAVFGIVGAVAYARALEHGAVGPVTSVLWVIEVVVPGIVGVMILGDGVRTGWATAAIAAVVVALVGCVVLAMSPSQPES